MFFLFVARLLKSAVYSISNKLHTYRVWPITKYTGNTLNTDDYVLLTYVIMMFTLSGIALPHINTISSVILLGACVYV